MKTRKRMTRTVWLAALATAGTGGLWPVLAQEVDRVGRGQADDGVGLVELRGGSVIFVDAAAAGADDGSSWSDAFNDLQDALDAAVADDQVWVAAGTYKPDQDEAGNVTPGEREATFQLVSSVGLCGGYRGCPGGV